jgi:hypothetical protein
MLSILPLMFLNSPAGVPSLLTVGQEDKLLIPGEFAETNVMVARATTKLRANIVTQYCPATVHRNVMEI